MKTKASSTKWKHVCPSVCPGVCSTRTYKDHHNNNRNFAEIHLFAAKLSLEVHVESNK